MLPVTVPQGSQGGGASRYYFPAQSTELHLTKTNFEQQKLKAWYLGTPSINDYVVVFIVLAYFANLCERFSDSAHSSSSCSKPFFGSPCPTATAYALLLVAARPPSFAPLSYCATSALPHCRGSSPSPATLSPRAASALMYCRRSFPLS